MQKLLLYSLLLLSYISFAQNTADVTIAWTEKTEVSFGNYKINIPQFTGNSYQYKASEKKLLFSLELVNPVLFEASNVQITNIVYETITTAQLGDLALENIPQQIVTSLRNTQSRGITQSFLLLSPIVKDEYGYKRINSFSYSITSSTAKIAQSNKSTNTISNSVLATGDWYRFYIEKSGVYKIPKNFLQDIGINVNSINPKKLKIFGNGGKMLPLSNNIYYPSDLTENAIQIIGENDGTFDNEDYILFYAEGLDTYNEESQTYNNLYDSKSYYYITTSGDEGKRIKEANQPTGSTTLSLTTFDDHQFHELDLINIAKLGRQWFGESFDINQEQEFEFNFPNIDLTTAVKIKATVASAAYTPTSFKITSSGQNIGAISFSAINTNSETEFIVGSLPSDTSLNASESLKIKLTYNNNGVPGSKGFLDNIQLIAKRKLQGYGKQFNFQYDASVASFGVVNYTLSNAAAISQVWDVTDLFNVSKFETTNQPLFSFKANLGELREYVAIDPSDYFTPLKDSKPKVSNQNIKGSIFKNNQGQFEDIDYVIITPNSLITQAEKLASFHRSYSKLNVKVITTESIYPEFSSGKQDIAAIRNCIKYIYENASTTAKRIKYVNLFGDASYDYKNRTINNTNIVPIYHALNSRTTGEASFASDDFYGLMDSSEGNIISYFGGIDIAVGRMIVNDPQQAEEMVNKVIEYHDIKSYGSWRNNFVMISDDSDQTSDANLQSRQNKLADIITTQKPFFNINKIILDSYVQEASAGGFRYPKARTDLFNAFEKGALVFNYLGHGGEDGLSAERIWEKSDGQNLSNQYKYPLFITITCEFSRFDNPSRPTAGEYTYWNPKGGAIAMITTIRSIGQFSAENFNDVLSEKLFSFDSSQYTSIAEALRLSKNSNPNSATNVVFFLGDPALFLAIPKPKIKLTKVNDIPISQTTDDFKSLARMKVSGEITDENDTRLTNYNGEVSTTIFDKTIPRTTLNNDNNSPAINFNTLGETIFRGNASITNGLFEFNLVVPRDIRIPLANGKISFYAKKNQTLENETGFDTSILIGGINENATADNISPKVKLYMNDETFVSGDITNTSPFLLAFLEDENGINTASGIGHDIVAILDGDVTNPYLLNDYYQTNLDDYTKGSLRFPLRNIAVGLHTITFKAWDVYNNPTTTEIQFVVIGDESITLTHVLNYPNPFVNYTEFWFTHNRPYEPLMVQIQVMTITGKVVWTKNQIISTEGFLSKEITWDGKDDFGNRIGKGVYIYKLTVKSTLTNKRAEKFEKLVLL
ncbi:type IX secretion system sortase PorU [Flavobacterium sp. Arc3]|uniref:type IX secretion system sortase PorU n=1 Tax=Flavobacterium sp. Arc3 TaxID=3046686 RepID=UPI00352EC7BE